MGMPNYDSALVQVLEAAGGPSRVAEHLGLVPSAVTQWSRVPARHVPRLEALTGIPGRVIRPDLWDAPSAAPKRTRRAPALPVPEIAG
jgi:DNA-binding transcriptional regulator YdaS (Cro superfamily)